MPDLDTVMPLIDVSELADAENDGVAAYLADKDTPWTERGELWAGQLGIAKAQRAADLRAVAKWLEKQADNTVCDNVSRWGLDRIRELAAELRALADMPKGVQHA